MAKKIEYLTGAVLFIVVNLYVGLHLYREFKIFQLRYTPILVKTLHERTPGMMGVFDIDHDGEDEVVYSPFFPRLDKKPVSVFEHDRRGYNLDHYADIMVPINSAFFGARYDTVKKVCVLRFLEHKGREIVLKEYDNRQNLLNKPFYFEPPGLDSMDRGSWILKPVLKDLDGDGKEELIVVIQSGEHDYFGGVFCYELSSGKLLWRYRCAAAITDIAFADLDGGGDRRQEIILSSYGANKGLRLNGIRDTFSYVIVLDGNGEERWRQVTGSWNTYARTSVSDLDNDGIPEIVTARESSRVRSEMEGKISCFDGKTGKEKNSRTFPGVSLTAPAILKYNSTVTRVYVGDSNGVVRVFDSGMNLLKERKRSDNGPLYILNTPTHGADWPYVTAMTPGRLLVFDRELEETAYTYRFSKPIAENRDIRLPLYIPLAGKNHRYGLVAADRLYRLCESPVSYDEYFWETVFPGILPSLIILILFNGFFAVVAYRRFMKGNHRPDRETSESFQFLEAVQQIAYQAKEPITGILWTAEKIRGNIPTIKSEKTRESYRQLSQFLVEDVGALRKQTNNILKLIQAHNPRFNQQHLKPLLQHLLDHYRALIDEKTEFHLEMEEDISLAIDEELISEAMVILMDNAVDAMPGGGGLTISAIPVTSPSIGDYKEVLIEVEDTGCGIDEENLEKIFDPFYTAKEKGTGIGLTICKRI
ncbi:MAG: hypothetical protein GY940_45510, partial [bacterium]|nr:hypothetical protein [bacterium]